MARRGAVHWLWQLRGRLPVRRFLREQRDGDRAQMRLLHGPDRPRRNALLRRRLEFGDIEELRAKYGDVAAIAPITDDTGTGPNVVFTPSRLNPDGALEGVVLNEDHEVVSETIG